MTAVAMTTAAATVVTTSRFEMGTSNILGKVTGLEPRPFAGEPRIR